VLSCKLCVHDLRADAKRLIAEASWEMSEVQLPYVKAGCSWLTNIFFRVTLDLWVAPDQVDKLQMSLMELERC